MERNRWGLWREEKKRRARVIRMLLYVRLGNCCAFAARGGCRGKLEVNHVFGRKYDPNTMDCLRRIVRYWRDYLLDPSSVNLLCKKHNGGYVPIRRVHEGCGV